eukprot:m.146261 g.146261  ORF g.146261 m.146261 type:complete len:441 (+) comp17766_c0_seq2:166-1488(+)
MSSSFNSSSGGAALVAPASNATPVAAVGNVATVTSAGSASAATNTESSLIPPIWDEFDEVLVFTMKEADELQKHGLMVDPNKSGKKAQSHGGRNARTRASGTGSSHPRHSSDQQSDGALVSSACYNCRGRGTYARNCPEYKPELAGGTPDDAPTLENTHGPLHSNQWSICFDTPTPRPHLIIFPKGDLYTRLCVLKGKVNLNTLSRSERDSLVAYCCDCNVSFKWSCAVLSVHTGFFQSKQTNSFHAHFCGTARAVCQMVANPPPIVEKIDWDRKSAKRFEWNSREKFIERIRDYQAGAGRKGKGYYVEDVQNTKFSKLAARSYLGPLAAPCKLVFHPSEPRIGFVLLERAGPRLQQLQELLQMMYDFALAEKLFSRGFGAHICLRIGETWDGYDPSGFFDNVEAYIQCAPALVYQLHPGRDQWLEDLRRKESKSIVILT